jgi:hypothetical protein
MSFHNDLKLVIPTIVVDDNGISNYKYDKFKIKKIAHKGLGVVVTEDLTIHDINKVLVFGGILFNDKQHKKYMKINNDLKFGNNVCNSNISHITEVNDKYLNANPILYNDDIKMGWIGSYVNELSESSHLVYNAELIVFSNEDIIKYKTQIDRLPDCINKKNIVGIRIKHVIKKNKEITVNYGDNESFDRVNYKQKQPEISLNEDGTLLEVIDCNVLIPRRKK